MGAVAVIVLAIATWRALMPMPASLGMASKSAPVTETHFTAADGTPLNLSFSGRFNRANVLPAASIPKLLRDGFVASEDQRYWQHGGVDWTARFAALWGNFRAGHIERGASTIGEQVARILKPRPRTYWSHWIAGFDAGRLLQKFGHAKVLEFYLNQVPYGAQRRGVEQAARYYFGRDVEALDPAEQLALVVLVRSPEGYDPREHPRSVRRAVDQLATRMLADKTISATEAEAIRRAPIQPGRQQLAVKAGPFVLYATAQAKARGITVPVVQTTLDAPLQVFVQQALRKRVQELARRGVHDGAALVVDNQTGAVLAWAVAPGNDPFAIDPVVTPRQPGSALKPFVYGLAFARLGWQADHVLEDTPLAERVHQGVHRYRNYSGKHYGRVSVRYALANSLNIPAVRTAQAVGVPPIIDELQRFGFTTFKRSADFYGPAIVLGDGAVTLHDMVQGYASLARHGEFLPLHVLEGVPQPGPVQVLPADVTSLLASILSDPDARKAEFGADSVLDLPMPTAVKTGTSSDYHDIWTMGFDNRYTVGVWMGNLGGAPTDQLTGSLGPAPVLRQIFAHLRSTAPYAGLWHSPELRAVQTCEWIGPPACVQRTEWYLPHSTTTGLAAQSPARSEPRIAQPLPGEMLAIDPRLPPSSQRLRFTLDANGRNIQRVVWQVDGKPLPASGADPASWVLVPGAHRVSAEVWVEGVATAARLGPIAFSVAGPGAASD
ncbi:MAG TPA: transglycosylase domain-containing protein [Rhodanobacteraceae bacterium]|nr:transglycosylase domain-containing protein [Rhodanobacteraceae bacterium]